MPRKAIARATLLLLALSAIVALPACSNYRETRGDPDRPLRELRTEADAALQDFRDRDPSLAGFFDSAYAYAIFPSITKGAAGIGAANGDGVVYRSGDVIGYAEMTQVNVGLQLGGQSYAQLMFFEDQDAFRRFTRSDVEFSANASAVAADEGAARAADYAGGVAVFSMPNRGLMFEASLGGQDFDFTPAE